MKTLLLFGCALIFTLRMTAQSTDTLTVQQCRALAAQNSPLQQKKLYAESINTLQVNNIHSNSLPRINVGAQASWQSDVFGFPINSPLFEVPQVPKDQYKLSVDVAQRIWDGGSDRYVKQQRNLERDLAAAQVDVDVFQLGEIVTDLYFNALLLRESEQILLHAKADLENRLLQANASIKEGVALQTTADQVKIQMLKTDQQIAATHSDQQTVLEILVKWVGKPVTPILTAAADKTINNPPNRPEYNVFALQQRSLQLGKDALTLRNQPRVEAFLQGGVGRPNPFNFFETGFKPFVLIGLRAAWTPFDWGNRGREAQVFDLQAKNVAAQRAAFDQRLQNNTLKDQADAAKWTAQLQQDDAIIALQSDIIRRADAQVKNGVMTDTDYLTQLNILTQARLTRMSHTIQATQAREVMLAKLGE